MKQGIIQYSIEIVRVMPYAISNQNSGTNLYTSLICENPEIRSLIKHFSNIAADFVMVIITPYRWAFQKKRASINVGEYRREITNG